MSAPIAWDYDTAIGFVRKALEDIGGKDGLIFDVRMEHVLADASLNDQTVRWWVEHQAYEDRECWEAIRLDMLYHAIIEILAGIVDPDTWPGECEVWNEGDYSERHSEPDEVIWI